MFLPFGKFSPKVRLGLVSASRSCFPRSLADKRAKLLKAEAKKAGVTMFAPKGDCAVIETKDHAREAALQMHMAGCDGAVLYLGNFSPEIEDANFVKAFPGPVMVIAAAEESKDTLLEGRGDALCGLLSATMAIHKRGLDTRVHVPAKPVVSVSEGAIAIGDFLKIVRVCKGIRHATLGLFGPRPRDFETCNYNAASVLGLGIEIEEFGLFDLQNEIKKVKAGSLKRTVADMRAEVKGTPDAEFMDRLSAYEKAVLNLRQQYKLSGMTSQCWAEQEFSLRHVPCCINARMAGKGFPIACENDVYSLTSELMGQYATDSSVTILDLNHSIPKDMDRKLSKLPNEDLVGLFHCGNTTTERLKYAEMKHQVIMKRVMEPDSEPDISRGTVEGQIAASPITVMNVHGMGDKLQAYIIEGEFLDVNPKTFGSTGTAHLPGFGRFYRHALLGRFHHHAAVAFEHCGKVLFDAMKLLGIETVYTPLPNGALYPSENPFG